MKWTLFASTLLLLIACQTEAYVNIGVPEHFVSTKDWSIRIISGKDSPFKIYQINDDFFAIRSQTFTFDKGSIDLADLQDGFIFSKEEKAQIQTTLQTIIEHYEAEPDSKTGELFDYIVYSKSAETTTTSKAYGFGSSAFAVSETARPVSILFRIQYLDVPKTKKIELSYSGYDDRYSIEEIKKLLEDLSQQ